MNKIFRSRMKKYERGSLNTNLMRNIEKEADKFFKELGLEEELAKLSEAFSDNFMIQGEETEDLKEILHRAPDSLLDLIWEKIGNKEAAEEDKSCRQRKEEILYKDIPEYLESRLIFMEPLKFKLLIRLMNNYPVEMMEAASIYDAFIPYGWVFVFYKDGKCSFVVTKEVRNIIMTIEKQEVRKQMEFVFGMHCIVNTCLSLYGVCKLEQIQNIYKMVIDIDEGEKIESTDSIDELLKEMIPYFEEQGVFWLDGDYLVSPYLRDREEYKELLRSRKNKYYVPDDQVIKSYSMGKMLEKNKEYETVLKLLTKEIKDCDQAEEMLEEISGYVIREDWEIPRIMNCLYEWNVAFDSPKSAEKMTFALSEWLYGIRRWSECGYSWKERNRENTNLKYIAYAKEETEKRTVKKIYPNDPCPCGSGKKYKKCCGRNHAGETDRGRSTI